MRKIDTAPIRIPEASHGIASLVGGVAAVATAQPYAVYYPLLLIGIILVVFVDPFLGSLKSARALALQLLRKDVAKICN
jgi:hypothetical protein